jgi:hypothetical protein
MNFTRQNVSVSVQPKSLLKCATIEYIPTNISGYLTYMHLGLNYVNKIHCAQRVEHSIFHAMNHSNKTF